MFGEHAAFIVPAYLITSIALLVTAIVIWRTYRVRMTELDRVSNTDENPGK